MDIDSGKVIELMSSEDVLYARIETDNLYTGGGGQPCDHAILTQNGKSFPISQTKEISGSLWWVIPQIGLEIGEVSILQDTLYHWEISQQHTAQHIFSGLALKRYGWKSDGFSIFPDYSKIELLGASTDPAHYELLERESNLVIQQGYPVRIYEAKPGDILRKADTDHTRVVEIEGVDKCCCGGTHVSSTDQIGAFTILQVERKNKESVRCMFGAGLRLSRVIKHYAYRESQLKSKLKGDIEERTDILLRENDLMRDSEKELIQLIADLVPPSNPVFKRSSLPLSGESLKYLALAIQQKGITSVLINREGYFVLSGPGSEEYFQELKQQGAKGGGKGVITGKLP